MNKVYCLMGPTAAGKTAIALELVARGPFEIVSVDSAMIYRGMDIGTAKPSADELARAPHRLIDILEPEESYSAADFVRDAKQQILEIRALGKVPLLVGGTMLYYKALQQGLSILPEADPAVRADILAEAEQKGWAAMHEALMRVDPESANKIHPNDPQRLQRALEIYRLTGKTRSQLWREQSQQVRETFVNIAVMVEDRAVLHARIAARFTQMLADGFIEEVERLRQRPGLCCDMPSMRAVGYRQAWAYLDGGMTLAQLTEKAVAATRQLAKRQITWLRRWPELQAFSGVEDVLVNV